MDARRGAEKEGRCRTLSRFLAAAATAIVALAVSPVLPGIDSGAAAQRLILHREPE